MRALLCRVRGSVKEGRESTKEPGSVCLGASEADRQIQAWPGQVGLLRERHNPLSQVDLLHRIHWKNHRHSVPQASSLVSPGSAFPCHQHRVSPASPSGAF